MTGSRGGFLPRILGAVIIGVFALSGAACKNRFLFYPERQIVSTPAASGLAWEDVYFTTDDGVRLNGWWVPASSPRCTVLFCHGNGGNISYLVGTIGIYHSLNFSVLVFDYRGYGMSGGVPSEEGTYRDVRAAWDFLTETKSIAPVRIVVIGRSLGGPIAAWLCRSAAPAGLVLESTFTCAADVADSHCRISPGRLVFGDTYDTASYAARADCPVLVIHSPDDEIVPFELGERLYRSIPGSKEFLRISGSHNAGFIKSVGRYSAGLDMFVKMCLR
ncbi:MAG: alpha/beta hydrolase [Spirochaetes bacterium]|nr:alpha/beta hydrolase [Spirochaetota bacterium]